MVEVYRVGSFAKVVRVSAASFVCLSVASGMIRMVPHWYACGMCGRAWQSITAADFRRLFQVDLPEAFVPRYNLAPTQEILLVLQDEEGKRAHLARWSLRASVTQPTSLSTFNARAATAPTSPLFGAAFRSRRALIPLSGIYEWTGGKGKRRPLGITRKDGRPVVCAGLWQELEGERVLAG